MSDFIQQSILPYNLPLTGLMGLVALYWVLSLVGTIDMDGIDFDFDGDADVDGEVSSEVSTGGNFIGTVLKFVNAQDVPIMMVLSLLILFMWITSILSNFYLNPEGSNLMALGLGVGNFIFSTLCVKAVTQPLRPLFKALKKDEQAVPLIGAVGTVKSRVMDENFGQVTVPREGGSPALLNAKLSEGALVRGDTVIVLSYDEGSKRYLVKAAPELSINN